MARNLDLVVKAVDDASKALDTIQAHCVGDAIQRDELAWIGGFAAGFLCGIGFLAAIGAAVVAWA